MIKTTRKIYISYPELSLTKLLENWHLTEGNDKPLEKPHKCKFCQMQAKKAYIWADGRAYIPACENHDKKVKKVIEDENNDEIADIKELPRK